MKTKIIVGTDYPRKGLGIEKNYEVIKTSIEIPIMSFGRYIGKRVDTLPNSYLRWIMTQNDFPKEILECAKDKLSKSEFNDKFIEVSRHALDMFSKRFLDRWLQHVKNNPNAYGFATFVVISAQEAWDGGFDISKNRYENDGTVKECNGIKWVFGINQDYPDFKTVITVMPSDINDMND